MDDKVLRLLRLARRVGALDPEFISNNLAGPPGPPALAGAGLMNGAAMISPDLLRRATAASFVLLRNEAGALPLDPASLSSVTVAGPNAFWPTIQGGGSAGVMPSSVSVPADAITAALAGRARVHAVPGCETWEAVPAPPPASLTDPVSGQPGLRLEFRTAAGREIRGEHRTSATLTWWEDSVPAEVGWGRSGRIVLRTVFRATQSGPHLLGVSGIGGLTLWLDDKVVIDETTRVPEDPVEAITRPGEARTLAGFEAGQEAELRLEFVPAADGAGPLGVRLGIIPASDARELLAEAVDAAARSDAAVVVVGSAELTESEGFDRATLALPGHQDELIRRVAAVNRRTIVVVNAGMPVLMPWAQDVQAIIYAWLPGQAMGEVLADVLLGAAEPGGRLPVTLPAAEADCPVLHAAPEGDDVLPYAEGLLVGYRGYDARGIEPALPVRARPGLHHLVLRVDGVRGAGGRRARPGRGRHRPQHRVPARPGGGPGLRGAAAGRPGAAGPGAGRLRDGGRRAGRGGPAAAAAARAVVRALGRVGGRLGLARGPVPGPRGPLGPRPAADRRGAVRLSLRPGPRGRAGLRPTATLRPPRRCWPNRLCWPSRLS